MSKAFICSVTVNKSGAVLDEEEISFLKETQPCGVILFKQNCKNKEQVKALTDSVKEILGPNALILVDQEGGKIQRLKPPVWKQHPAANSYLSNGLTDDVYDNVDNGAREIAKELVEVGINVDCFPVLDVPVSGSSLIIGSRAYSSEPDQVAVLGRLAGLGMKLSGVFPVIKHIPGHGRATVDSHHALPFVDTSLEELKNTDFVPFVFNNDFAFGMVAHVVYTAIDANEPASQSKTVIQSIIRDYIGFKGLLMTDDLTMDALSGSFKERAKKAIDAGIDIVLICNDTLDDAREVASVVPEITIELDKL